MSVPEIVCGVILLLSAVAIIFLTLSQQPKGRGLSGAIMGDAGQMAAGRSRTNDAKLARYTKVLGVVFCVVTLAVSIIAVRLG